MAASTPGEYHLPIGKRGNGDNQVEVAGVDPISEGCVIPPLLRAAKLAAIPAGENPAGGTCPVATVVISGGEG